MEESGSPHELGTSAMIRSPSRSAQYSLRGDSTFTCSDRKSTRLNSSHLVISYAVFCLKKKNDLIRPSSVSPRSRCGPCELEEDSVTTSSDVQSACTLVGRLVLDNDPSHSATVLALRA